MLVILREKYKWNTDSEFENIMQTRTSNPKIASWSPVTLRIVFAFAFYSENAKLNFFALCTHAYMQLNQVMCLYLI